MKKLLLIIGFSAACAACNKGDVPKDILGREKMAAVYWDYLMLETYFGSTARKDSTKDIPATETQMLQQFYKKHNITAKEFAASFNYYVDHSELMQPLLDTLIRRHQYDNMPGYIKNNPNLGK